MEPIIIIGGKARRPIVADMLKALTPSNHELAETFIGELESAYAPSHVNSIMRETLKYMNRLQNRGVDNALDSTNKDIVAHCHSMETQSEAVKQHRIGYLRIFLHFLNVEHGLSPSLEMTANIFVYDRIVFLDELSDQKQCAFETISKSDKATSIERGHYWSHARKLCARIDSLNYSFTTKSVFFRAWRCFYVFLCANELDYSSELADYWVKETIAPELVCWASYRRAFMLFDHYIVNGCLSPESVYHQEKKGSDLPLWCADPLAEYLLMKKRDGQAATSVKMQRVCNLRFLEYILVHGVTKWEELTPAIVMDFHIQDAHSTTESKNAYGSRVRQFVGFLAECGYVPEALALALPSSKVKRVSIVEVLADDALDQIAKFKEKATDPIELRSVCIVLLGLRLGLRGNDIVNLKLADICWQKQEITVMQSKTGCALTLPMPVEVANCLYRYILHGRPDTTAHFVFVRHHGPFCQLHRSACGAALARVLDAKSTKAIGFHITRKTFASRMLASSVPVDTIVDALGHTTNTTVHKYLSTDEAGMRNCAIPLAAVPVSKGMMPV